MNRRGFLSSVLALGAAPAVVRAASLMPWKATDSGLLVQDSMWWGVDYAVGPDFTGTAVLARHRAGQRLINAIYADYCDSLVVAANLLKPEDFE